MGAPPADAFPLDEEPLRKTVLKGYFGQAAAPLEPEPLMGHLRQLLSGPPGGETDPSSYYFEQDPHSRLPAFLKSLEVERPGLAALIAEPLLAKVEELAGGKRAQAPLNLSVYVSSVAGAVAVKADMSEATAGALLAGFLIALARLGPSRVRALYREVVAQLPRRNV